MVATLNDQVIVIVNDRIDKDTKEVSWTQDHAVPYSSTFHFFQCYRANDSSDVGFVAVEEEKFEEFKKITTPALEASVPIWKGVKEYKYEFTVTDQFKYGENPERTFRFFVFQGSNYKPYQRRFTEAFAKTEVVKTLNDEMRRLSDFKVGLPIGRDIWSILHSVGSNDLLTFN